MARVIERSGPDRRSGLDRRQAYDIRYFQHGGIEYRCHPERRISRELRMEWVRITQWSSIFLGAIKFGKTTNYSAVEEKSLSV